MNLTCYCGNLKSYLDCCGQFINNQSIPRNAEELMRSRYTAYAMGMVDYLVSTDANPNEQSIRDWMQGTKFTALRILATEAGQAEDDRGVVSFEADYTSNGQQITHRETSLFEKRQEKWIFVRGKQTPLRTASKAGRNDPCPCGSGKKYKKCCADN